MTAKPNGYMIERRYGRSNRDWLIEITVAATTWSGARRALVFPSRKAADLALAAVRRLARLWPDADGFGFAVIHDRRHLPSYMASTEPVRRTRARSWDVFERRFEPVTHDDGSLLWEFDDIPQPVDVQRLWTVLDCDGKLYLAAGSRYVNRIGYVLTRQPWRKADEGIDYRYD